VTVDPGEPEDELSVGTNPFVVPVWSGQSVAVDFWVAAAFEKCKALGKFAALVRDASIPAMDAAATSSAESVNATMRWRRCLRC
jgi:hypothetical protein